MGHMHNDPDSIRHAVLEAVEASLSAQLKAVQRLRSSGGLSTASGAQSPGGLRTRGRSQVSMAYDVLKDAKQALHVSEIISRIAARFGATVDRDSLVSALSKRVVRHDVFARTDKNTFALIPSAGEGQKEVRS